jgi:hypothetical protein
MKNKIFMRAVVVAVGLCVGDSIAASTNQVSREIYRDEISVKVRDAIQLPLERSRTIGVFGRILEAKRGTKESLLREVEKLYVGEDLAIEQFNVNSDGGKFVLTVTSRVIFPAKPNQATLRLSPTYCESLRPDPASPEDAEPVLQIISIDEHKFLLFPDWSLPEEDEFGLKTVTSLLNMDYQAQELLQLQSDLKIRCLLRSGQDGEHYVLFDYQPDRAAFSGPDPKLLEKLHEISVLSGNDLRNLFTKIKLAKPGFYPIGTNTYSNRPPISLNGQKMFTFSSKESKATLRRPGPSPSIGIDGRYSEWVSARIFFPKQNDSSKTNFNYFSVSSVSFMEDRNFFYFFFKYRPDIKTRFNALFSNRNAGSIGNIGRIVCDTDLKVSTGYTGSTRGLEGVDLALWVSAGSRVLIAGENKIVTQPSVACILEKWDALTKEFVRDGSFDSTGDAGLICYDQDGVELAVERSKFGILSSGDVEIELIPAESSEPFTQVVIKKAKAK